MASLDQYARYFDGAAKAWNIDPRLLRAVALAESGGDENTPDSAAGAAGLMQIMPDTAKRIGVNPYVPEQAIYAAARIMDENLHRYGNVPDALRAYNAGTDPSRWSNPETRDYVGRVAGYFRSLPDAPHSPAARPEGTSMPTAKSARPSDDAMMAALTGGQPAPGSATAKGATTSRPDDEAMMRMLTGSSAVPVPTAAGQVPVRVPAEPSMLESLGAGIGRGVKDVRDTIVKGADWVDRKVPALSRLDESALGITPAQRAARVADLDREERAYDQRYGKSLTAAAARIGGNLVATAPVLGPVGDGVGAVLGAGRAAVGFGDNLLTQGLTAAARGSVEGAAGGALTAGGYGEDPIAAARQGAEFGAGLGVAAPAMVGAARAIGSTAKGGSLSPEVARLAKTAIERYGIPIPVGQMSDNSMVRTLDQYSRRIPLSGGDAETAVQQAAFNRAVGETIGLTGARKITPDDWQAAKRAIGQRMDDIGRQTTIKADQQLLDELAALHDELPSTMTDQEARPVQRQIDNVLNAFDANGEMNGQLYQNLTKTNAPLAKAIGNRNSNIGNAAMDVKNILAGAALRSLQASGTPELAKHLTHARFQYKNLKTIEPLVNKSPTGDISAPGLLEAVRSKFGDNMAEAGPLGDLGRIGKRFMKEPADSGTPTGQTVMSGLAKAGGIGAGVVTGAMHPAEAALAVGTALGTIGAGRAARAYLGSTRLAKGAIENALAPPQVPNALLDFTGQNAGIAADPFANALIDPSVLRDRSGNQGRRDR